MFVCLGACTRRAICHTSTQMAVGAWICVYVRSMYVCMYVCMYASVYPIQHIVIYVVIRVFKCVCVYVYINVCIQH